MSTALAAAVEPRKICPGCMRHKPLTEFPVRSRNPDGTPRYRQHRCDPCYRAYKRDWAARRRGTPRAPAIAPVDREKQTLLPIAPWRAWLQKQLGEPDTTLPIIAARLGVDPRRLWCWLEENERVPLDAVDRCLCRIQEPALLRDLWPDLYDFDDDQQAVA